MTSFLIKMMIFPSLKFAVNFSFSNTYPPNFTYHHIR